MKSTPALILAVLLPACSSAKMEQQHFSLYLNGKSYTTLQRTLAQYSKKHQFSIISETLKGANDRSTANNIMVEGYGVRSLVQSALAEQCKEREGSRAVEYSSRVFDVTSFSTSYFTQSLEISRRTNQMKEELTGAGMLIMSGAESCDFL